MGSNGTTSDYDVIVLSERDVLIRNREYAGSYERYVKDSSGDWWICTKPILDATRLKLSMLGWNGTPGSQFVLEKA